MYDIDFIQPNIFWYVIGYIATDGSLSKDGRHVVITSKDIEHLKKIKIACGITSNICMKSNGAKKEKKYGVLQIGNVKFYKFLNNIGIQCRKSWHMDKLDVPTEYFRDFLRGVIDGDGCLHSWKNKNNGYTQWALRVYGAAEKFIRWVKKETQTQFFVEGKIHEYQKDNNRVPMYLIKFGKLASQKILQSVYYPNCFCLERKLSRVNICLLDSAKMVNYGGVLKMPR